MGLSQIFFLLGRTLVSKRGFKPNTEAQVLAPTVRFLKYVVILIFFSESYSYLLDTIEL